MSMWTAEEVFEGLERWLKVRRDECPRDTQQWYQVDGLLDELRDNGYEGFFPWQRISRDDMPVFVLKAQDMLAMTAIDEYHNACLKAELHDHAEQVEMALVEFQDWQAANPERMKMPDHKHVPHGCTCPPLRTGMREYAADRLGIHRDDCPLS